MILVCLVGRVRKGVTPYDSVVVLTPYDSGVTPYDIGVTPYEIGVTPYNIGVTPCTI
jgi:hypothetical protein